ncbi:hypothetical protein EW026_g7297 [Hermanssonia centrifuga]|uniref:Acyl-CoA dehydrogenase n=1 Tax=Hermanssonia centrifuga TaxID=98765 RepID=A0A4S4K8A8_9APHY|nr:hypothetical protein EW026_g7297 [Hermanssonia centrifuga]
MDFNRHLLPNIILSLQISCCRVLPSVCSPTSIYSATLTILKLMYACVVSIRHEIERDLTRLGGDLMGPIRQMSDKVTNPKFVQYNHWGRRIDSLETSEGWRFMRDTAIKEGYINIPYARKYGEYSRIYGFLKNMIMTGDFHVIMCPLGMTDGTARVIELVGSEAVKRTILPRLISRDPSIAYTSGQWMTERPGGSDVSLTETVATSSSTSSTMGDMYTLDGFKWFSSATEADMAIALARTGSQEQGSRALSLFLVPLRLPEQGGPSSPLENGIEIHRLKNKIGTVGVPTAELSLNHTKAWLLGPLNGGVKAIAPVLNITRIHSAIHSIVRLVQGGSTLLKDVPLYVSSLAKVSLLYRALTHMTFGTVVLLGKSECGTATKEEEARLRLLTPMAKAFTAQQAPSAMEECMAALGAQGYMEETGIGR